MISQGIAIPIYAVRSDGTYAYYESMSKAAIEEKYSVQYIHKDKKKDITRKYQSDDPKKRGTRFTTDESLAKLVSKQNKENYNKYNKTTEVITKPKSKCKFIIHK